MSSPYKRYYKIFYKGLYGAHWVYDREHFAITVGFNKGTLLYDRGRWTKVKPGAYPSAFFGRDAGGRELWCLGTSKMIVSSWDKLLGRASSRGVRNEPIGEDEYLSDFAVIDDVAIAVGDGGKVFRRTSPVTSAAGTWKLETTLKPIEDLVAIDGTSTDDVWIAGRKSAWHWNGAVWKRVKLSARRERAIDVLCGPKGDAYICGGETLFRIRRGRAQRFDAAGCDFQSVAIYDGEVYLNVAESDDEFIGIWTLRRDKLVRVTTGFPPGWEHQPCGQLEVRAGLLWSFGAFGVYVFDGKRWEQLPNPKV